MKDSKQAKVKKQEDAQQASGIDQSKKEVLNDAEMVPKTQLARALADYDNLKKRIEQEKSVWLKFATQEVIARLLPVLDMFEAAQKHLNDQGLDIALNGFKKVLIDQDLVEIIPKVGEDFDHDLHEVVEVVDGEDGKIVEVLQSGWKFKEGAVIRHARVKVSKKQSN
ncbi:MAG: nucleotide exchange factor GrpE [Patescibacteria group bacterium]|nr:nucleotide exchange factor GrpE [Patescibacteria group bacterium]